VACSYFHIFSEVILALWGSYVWLIASDYNPAFLATLVCKMKACSYRGIYSYRKAIVPGCIALYILEGRIYVGSTLLSEVAKDNVG